MSLENLARIGTERRTFLKTAGATGLTAAGFSSTGGAEQSDDSCSERTQQDADVYVTVLGSGASALKNGRSSVGYVVHIDGEPKLLVDAGGGTASAISETQTDITKLDLALFTHLHIDHTVDFPAILKAAYQQGRDGRPWEIYGPSGKGIRPGMKEWASKMFNGSSGTYSYLREFVGQYLGTNVRLKAHDIDAPTDSPGKIQRVYSKDGLTVEAAPTKHGAMPSLAYRVSYQGTSFTFTGDYSSKLGNVPTLAKGTDVMIQNRLLEPESKMGSSEPKRVLHSTPREIGMNAQKAKANMLVLSHISRDTVTDLSEEIKIIIDEYDGPIAIANDLVDVYPDGRILETKMNGDSGASGTSGDGLMFIPQ
ncbi:MBL fold metallo-hydrolase [Haladaptatus sp. T7]|uniref:MBL fold metallo-hydrolase n=1 Tax=Haladaptatus sp. T7 TaxID=2029368 RepID=UPI0021A2557E|nr:MBL fold metallo-hydrolase [Haladaptatus sp. T7]GKZ16030.1 arylsulfatase [Haladaptatus sp. T7]